MQRMWSEPGFPFRGRDDERTLTALYEWAWVLAFPSLYEGFGLPLLEAMARGVPAVVGSTGALPELAQGAAVGGDAQNVDAIAAGLPAPPAARSLGQKHGHVGPRGAAGYTPGGGAP